MKRFIAAILTLSLVLIMAGCSATYYRVTTKTGKVYTAKGALRYDVDQKTYSFQNEQGREVVLNKEDIEDIIEKN